MSIYHAHYQSPGCIFKFNISLTFIAMRQKQLIFLVVSVLIVTVSCNRQAQPESAILKPVSYDQITMEGELLDRAMRNFDRLETDIYHPENVYPEIHHRTSVGWPGDKEGRVILGLVLQAQATHRTPVYLEELIDLIPENLNEEGYLGPLQGDTINEQQLSGHGWFLRALCEYYTWKQDEEVAGYIQTIIRNLALPTKGHHANYPIDQNERRADVGAASGTHQNVIGNWLLSSDVGCDFIFLDGVIHAWALFPDEETKELIEEMIARFMEIDLVKIKAQTHATLTATRALIRYFNITGERYLLDKAIRTFDLYKSMAMTENYENFNWFERPEWTEPCAIVDAFMVAVQLWTVTRNEVYINDAHNIYYNALGHTQRANGGYGCDNCPSGVHDPSLSVHIEEAFWCCTMRGGEGLASAISYSYFTHGDTIILPFYHNSRLEIGLDGRPVQLKQETGYPFDGKTTIELSSEAGKGRIPLKIFIPPWAEEFTATLNGEEIPVNSENGFATIIADAGEGTVVGLDLEMRVYQRENINKKYADSGTFSFMYGPLILGYEGEGTVTYAQEPTVIKSGIRSWTASDGKDQYLLSPVYHLLDERVSKESGYSKQIIFTHQNTE